MSAVHTPGPWCIGDSTLPVSQLAILQTNSNNKHSTIARMASGVQSFEEVRANMKLMAVAPQLLEALKISQTLLKKTTPYPGQEDLLSEAVAMNAGVITKATGSQA